MSVHLRRRIVALAALVVAVAGALALLQGGKNGSVPEAGSAYGAAGGSHGGGSSLLSALAPLLSAGAATASPRTTGRTSGSSVGGGSAAGTPTAEGVGSNPGVPVDRAVARLFVVGFPGVDPSAPFFQRLRVREWGGVLLTSDNFTDAEQLMALTGQLAAVARGAGHQPPIVVARQAGGEESAFGGLPPGTTQVDQLTDAAARTEARRTGAALHAVGVTMTLSPDADLGAVGGPWDGRAFAPEADIVASRTQAAVAGYRAAGTISTVGHFPGEGAASGDPGAGPATVGLGLDELKASDLLPFAAVARSAPVVQMSGALYAAYDGVTPASLLPEAVALLRGPLRFRGVVLSSDLGAAAFAEGLTPGQAAVEALNAGCDLLLLPGDATDQEEAVRTVMRAVRNGDVHPARLREALARVAALRRAYGVGAAATPTG